MSRIDRSRRPDPGPRQPFRFPDFEHRALASGIDVFVATDRRFPLAEIGIVLSGGADRDPLTLRGLTSLGSALLDEGTEELDAHKIAAFAERRGAELATSSDWDAIYVRMGGPTRHWKELFGLATAVLARPTLPEHELDRLRAMRLADLASRSVRPAFLAAQHALGTVFGSTHPYGETTLGTPTSIEALERQAVEAWHRERIATGSLAVVAVGDLDPDELVSAIEHRLLPDLPTTRSPVRQPDAPALPDPGPLQVRIIDRPAGAQTELRLMSPGLSRSSPLELDARLFSLTLGGKFTSRLNLNLREQRGVTYGVSSRLARRRGDGPFTVGCAVDTEAVGIAVEEILKEMSELADSGPTATEVEDGRNYLLGTFPYKLQTLEGVAGHLEEIALHELPHDTWQSFPERLQACCVTSVRNAARHLLEAAPRAIVAVGPANALTPQLERFGQLEIVPAFRPEEPAGG